MGNALVHLCPQLSSKVVSKYRRMGVPTAAELERSRLDSSELHIDQQVAILSGDARREAHKSPQSSLAAHPRFGPKIAREHLNFPFLTDDEMAYWISNTRFMFILRGPPGSGKSYIAEFIRLRFPSTKICSADNFWYLESDGLEYQFDVSRLAEAHQWCQNEAFNAAAFSVSPIVIDNTNVRAWETRYYTDLARKFGYTVIMVTPQTPWRFDAETLAMKNVHFVSFSTVEAKVRNFEHVFPLYYGWQWPGSASEMYGKQSADYVTQPFHNCTASDLPAGWPSNETHDLLLWSWNSLVTIVSLPDIHVQLASALSYPESVPLSDILRHWQSATLPPFGVGLKTSPASSVPHITARYSRFGRAPGAEQYGLSAAVTECLLGRLFTVQVTGLFFSLRTVGIRVRLPADDLVLRHLWGSEDQTQLTVAKSSPIEDNQSDTESPGPTRIRPVGCRAHVTLALAADVSAVETGLDLLRIVDAELADQPGEHMAIIPGGSVRRVTVPKAHKGSSHFLTAPSGCEYVYVYDLDSPQHHRVLFSAAY